VAERSSLVRLRREYEVDFTWVGYELHPETPPGGVALSEWLGDADAMLGYVKSFAASFGIPDLVPPERLANTRRALAVAEHARDAGRLDPFCDAAYDTYWRWGGGLETDEELAGLARRAGLDPGAAVAAARDPALLARVDGARRAALAARVGGVPTLDVDAESPAPPPARIVGCQRYEELAEAVRRAGARRRDAAEPVRGG
jgi:predicted DsbA family dithiol-disulfide isomerase